MKKIIFSLIIVLSFTFNLQSQILHIYSGDNNKQYLGCLNCNNLDGNSIWNELGTYGSKYNSYSIWNDFGTYGSEYNDGSPWNIYSSNPPILLDSGNNFYGYFTVNTSIANRADFNLVREIYNNRNSIKQNVATWYKKLF